MRTPAVLPGTMEQRARLIAAIASLLLMLAACGSDSPTLVVGSDDADSSAAVEDSSAFSDDTSESTPASVADDSAPDLVAPSLMELVNDELVLGTVFVVDDEDLYGRSTQFTFHGSRTAPKLSILAVCGTGELELEESSDGFLIQNAVWKGCEADPVRSVLDNADAFTTTITEENFEDLVITAAGAEIAMHATDSLGFSFDEDRQPVWSNRSDDESQQIPEGWSPVPELSAETLAAEPLLAALTPLPVHPDVDPAFAQYQTWIGVSRYTLVDAEGAPIESGDDQYMMVSLNISAYHGEYEPVVYLARLERFFLHDQHGYQSACDHLVGPAVLEHDEFDAYELLPNQPIEVFEDRIAFGDGCGVSEGTPPDALTGRFTIEIVQDQSLVITNESGERAFFALDPLEFES